MSAPRIGLIARCDNTGLGTQSWEFFNHIPCKALVIDFSAMASGSNRPILEPHFDRFPGQTQFKWGNVHNLRGDIPAHIIEDFLNDIDILFYIETPYDFNIFDICRRRGIKTILQLNYEFLDYPSSLPHPDLFAAPSMWNWDNISEPKIFLPVPVNTDVLPVLPPRRNHFIHVAGRPAENDRNGTKCLFKALQHVKSDITVSVKTQTPIHLPNVPGNVIATCYTGNLINYWDSYGYGGVLVMPRKYGGLCLPINEAIASGMPVITTDISPNNEWLPSTWLVEAKYVKSFQSKRMVDVYEVDPVVLATKIDRFCNPEFYEVNRNRAIEMRSGMAWSALKEKYYEVFKKLMG